MKEARTVFKGIRYTADELAVVQRAADAAGQKLAVYVHDMSLRAGDAHAETDRVMDQQRALYEKLAPSIERQVAVAAAKALDDALAEAARRAAHTEQTVRAQMQAQTDTQFDALRRQYDDLAAKLQALVTALMPEASKPAAPVCPKCGKGHMVAKVANKGEHAGKTFYACSTAPVCKHTSWKPDGK